MHKRWIEIHGLNGNCKYKWNVYKKWSVLGLEKCKKKGFPSQWKQNPLPASLYVTWFPASSQLLFCLSCPHSLASFLEYAGILGPFCLHVFLSGMLFPRIFWWFISQYNQIYGLMCFSQVFSDYLPCLLPILHHCVSPQMQGCCLPCSLLYPQHQEQCPASSWCPIKKNNSMNKWVSEWRTLKQQKDLKRRTDFVAGWHLSCCRIQWKRNKSVHGTFMNHLF